MSLALEDDHSLLHRYRHRGDAEAFAELVRRYAAMVYRTALRVSGSIADAEDIAQECMLELASAHVRSSVAGFLHGTATRRALMQRRSEGRRRRREAAAVAKAASDSRHAADIAAAVDAALDELELPARELLIRRYLMGESQQSIGASLGVEQSTVSRRLSAAIGELRGRLGRRGLSIGGAEFLQCLEDLQLAPVPATVSANATKLGLAGAGRASCLLPPKLLTGLAAAMIVGTAVWIYLPGGTKMSVTPVVVAAPRPNLSGIHLRGFGMIRDSVSVSLEAVASVLQKPANYDELYLMSGNAFAPAIDTNETCRSWWHVQARLGTRNLPAAAARIGLQAEALPVPALPHDATDAQRESAHRMAVQLAKAAMERGDILITEGGWDEVGAWVWAGVVTHVDSEGNLRGAALSAATGDGKEQVLWKYPGILWAIRPAASATPPQEADMALLENAIARIRGTGRYAVRGADKFGLAAMDAWIASMYGTRGFCADCFSREAVVGVHDAPDNDRRLYSAAKIVAQQLRSGFTSLPADAREHLGQAAACYEMVTQLLAPAATGADGFRYESLSSVEAQQAYATKVLQPVKQELESAASHMERALAAMRGRLRGK